MLYPISNYDGSDWIFLVVWVSYNGNISDSI